MKEQISKWSIKARLGEYKLKQYELAAFLNITESGLSKKLREASSEQLKEIDRAVDELIRQRKAS